LERGRVMDRDGCWHRSSTWGLDGQSLGVASIEVDVDAGTMIASISPL
jgi:hypothetical protein